MRAHFLNPVFQLVQRKDEHRKEGSQSMKNTPKDIQDEIELYVKDVSYVVQFQSILSAIQEELRYDIAEKGAEPESEPEPEKAETISDLKDAEAEAEADAQEEEVEEIKRGGMKTRKGKNKRRKYVTYRRRRI